MNMFYYSYYNAQLELYYKMRAFLENHSESELSEIVDKVVRERDKNEQ